MVEPQKKVEGAWQPASMPRPLHLLLLLIGQLAVTPDLLNIPEAWLERLWRRSLLRKPKVTSARAPPTSETLALNSELLYPNVYSPAEAQTQPDGGRRVEKARVELL